MPAGRRAQQPPELLAGDLAGDVFAGLGMAVARHWRVVTGVWLAAVVVGLVMLPVLVSGLSSPPFLVRGSESERARAVLERGFPWFGSEQMQLVLRSERLTVNDSGFQAAIRAAAAAVRRQPGVAAVIVMPLPAAPGSAATLTSVFGPAAGLYHDRRTAYAVVSVRGDSRRRQDRAPAQQRAAEQAARAASGGAVSAYLVGVPSLAGDLQRIELEDLTRIELIAVPVTLLVLLLGLRAPIAALIPLAVAGVGVVIALGVLAALSPLIGVDWMLLIGVSAVGVGVGTDYALFVVSRYREEVAAGAGPHWAAGKALATSGRTVVYSGLVVLLAATSILSVRWATLTQFAIGIEIVIVAELAAVMLLLPAVLMLPTRVLEWRPLTRRPAHSALGKALGKAVGKASAEDRWARWSRHLMRHPWPYLLVITAALIMMAVPVTGMKTGIDLERGALRGTPAGTGLAILEREPTRGLGGLVIVLVSRPPGTAPPDIWPLTRALRADRQVAVVVALDNGRDVSAVFAVPRLSADSPQLVDLVHRIRGQILPQAGLAGHDADTRRQVLVGGPGAAVTDIVDEVTGSPWWVIGAVLTACFGLLVVVLRSVLLPLKAIAMNLLVTAATFGLLVVVFQHGAGAGLFGFTSPGLIWAPVPLVVFAVLFALSVDYELFLVRRIQEEYQAGGDNTAAVAAGVQHTARTITLAAIIMVAAFGALLSARVVGVKELGFAVAVAILLDATVIRLALVPALMQILGRWNWWLPHPPQRPRKPTTVTTAPTTQQTTQGTTRGTMAR